MTDNRVLLLRLIDEWNVALNKDLSSDEGISVKLKHKNFCAEYEHLAAFGERLQKLALREVHKIPDDDTLAPIVNGCRHTRRRISSSHMWKTRKNVKLYRYTCSTCGYKWSLHRCTKTGDVLDSQKLHSKPRKQRTEKFSDATVKRILLDKRSDKELAQEYKTSKQYIWGIRTGKSLWKVHPEIERRKIRRRVPAAEKELAAVCCNKCTYWHTNSCSFGFPDAGGFFAEECSLFSTD